MNIFSTLKKIEKIRFYVILLIVGLIFAGAAGFVLSRPKTELLSAEGVIERIESTLGTDGETQEQVFVTYTDNNGVLHEAVAFPSYSSFMKIGDTVTLCYDPASPERIQSPGGEYIPYVFLAIGVFAFAFALIKIISEAKKVKEPSSENTAKAPAPERAKQTLSSDEPTKEYYFHWTGKLNQSYVLETMEREAVYEAICDHIGVFTPYRYTFANRLSGTSTEHKVSHTVTSSYGRDIGNVNISFSDMSSSRFKVDGVNNWDHLSSLGYSIEPERSGIKLNFNILRGGAAVAYLEAAGVNILKDGAESKLGEKLPGTGLFKVSCRESDIEGVFFACFCLSRIELC